jgi:inorganic triphosphatase YgiF
MRVTENRILSSPGDPEINLWLALSLLDVDPHVQIRTRLKQLYKSQPQDIDPYIELSNVLLELPHDAAANFLVEALVVSEPAMDKLEDCATMKVLRSRLTPKNFELLESFIERCWGTT